MAARKSSSTSKSASQSGQKKQSAKKDPTPKGSTQSAGAEDVIIEGKAEDITKTTAKAAAAETATKSASAANPKTSQDKDTKPKKKTPLSLFAILLAVMALGLGGWSVFLAQQHIDPPWRGDLSSRITALENTSFDDDHLAQQNDLIDLASTTHDLGIRIENLTAELADLKAASPAAAAPTSDAIDREVLTLLQQEIDALKNMVISLNTEIEDLKAKTEAATLASEQQQSAPSNLDQPDPSLSPSAQQSWWQSLFGNIRISRITPQDQKEAE